MIIIQKLLIYFLLVVQSIENIQLLLLKVKFKLINL